MVAGERLILTFVINLQLHWIMTNCLQLLLPAWNRGQTMTSSKRLEEL